MTGDGSGQQESASDQRDVPPDGLRPSVVVDIDDRQTDHQIDHEHLAGLLASTLSTNHGAMSGEVGLAFIDVEEMTELNRAHMDGTGPTDVLAFPIDGLETIGSVPSGQPLLYGDIVICPEVAARSPQSLDDELALLVVHGALHLIGHDHAEPAEAAIMQTAEQAMLDRFHRR